MGEKTLKTFTVWTNIAMQELFKFIDLFVRAFSSLKSPLEEGALTLEEIYKKETSRT